MKGADTVLTLAMPLDGVTPIALPRSAVAIPLDLEMAGWGLIGGGAIPARRLGRVLLDPVAEFEVHAGEELSQGRALLGGLAEPAIGLGRAEFIAEQQMVHGVAPSRARRIAKMRAAQRCNPAL